MARENGQDLDIAKAEALDLFRGLAPASVGGIAAKN